MNRTIHNACRMIHAGKTLAEVRAYLDRSNAANCVFQEAWRIALDLARKGPRAKAPPTPQKVRHERVTKMYRAQRRNIRFFRPDVGNCTPATRF